MAALKLSISPETYGSKTFNFSANSLQSSDWYSISPLSGYLQVSVGCLINPFNGLKHTRVSRTDTELSGTSESSQVDDSGSKGSLHEKGPRKIWKKFRGVRKGLENVSSGPNSERTDNRQELMFVYKGNNLDSFSGGENAFYVNLGALGPDLNLDRCNRILKRLERCSDIKALRFFEWMQSNGKLKQNVKAYILALRVLARRENWHAAEMMIREMTIDSGCELNFQVFNTLIYACHKRGLVELGTKWFHMMLDNGVQPNVATFGMLMNLYQKGWNLEEAEFTFSQMRRLKLKCHSAYSAMITMYTRLGLYDKAELVMGFLIEDEILMNEENWLVLLNAHSQQGKLEEAERYLDSMQNAGFSPNIVAYNTLITGYGKVSKMGAAQRLFQNLEIVGLEPDETTYRSMIEGWGRADNYKETRWFYEELKRSGFKPNSSNLYTMIHLQAKHGDEEGAVITISDMIGMGCQFSSVLGILLHAYERAERFDKVPSVLKGAFYEHVLVNQMSCSILVTFYVKHNLVDDAIKVLQEKKWKDLVFEDNLYHTLICSCKELGYLENAVKIYTQMPKSNNKQNMHIICTMIDIYGIMNLFAEAQSLYLKLKSSGTALDMIAYSIVVRMLVKAGALNDACSVLDTMSRQKDIVPDIYLLRDMLRIYQQCGLVDKLADLYYKTLKTGVTWDQDMYNCVINCCARALPVDELSRIFDEMIQHGFAPSTITFNVMLDVLGKSKLFKKAKRVFWMAKKLGLADVISYNTIIAAYGRCKDLKNMLLTVREMQFNGFSVSLEAYNTMLDAYGKESQMEKFRDVLQRMKSMSCASDHYTYNIMINIYGEQGWIEEVANVLVELKESGVGPDLCSYNTLIKAYGVGGMVEDAVALVKEMRENGTEPDRITYINLITALRRNDKFLEAVKWSLWMKQMGM